jgi:hypothetical protein
MGLTMTVQGVGTERTAKLDLDEIEAIRAETQTNDALKPAFALVFEMPEPTGSKRVRCADFLCAIETILRATKVGLKAASVYSVYGSPMPGVIPNGSASGAGVKINGVNCYIKGGVNECTLTRYRDLGDGKLQPISVEDIRQVKVIRTDDQGDLEIRKRSKLPKTVALLHDLVQACETQSSRSHLAITIG